MRRLRQPLAPPPQQQLRLPDVQRPQLPDALPLRPRGAGAAGIPLDEQLLALTLERTCRDYMLANKHQFDDALMRELSETKGGLPPGSDSAKVRAGCVLVSFHISIVNGSSSGMAL